MHTAAKNKRVVRTGFTLIEVTVALAVFMLLLLIVFVPLNQAFDAFNAGRADITLQQAAQQSMTQIQHELQGAVFVFPNDLLPGVTDGPPYKGFPPYTDSASGACGGTRVANRSRLDFLVAKTSNGKVAVPVTPENYIVSYYCRRLNDGATDIYDKVDNPVTLFRAQLPYQYAAGSPISGAGVNTGSNRYAGSGCDALWLNQQPSASATPAPAYPDEPDLLSLTGDASSGGTTVYGSNTTINPRGTGLIVPDSDISLTPETSFICEDTNGDGKIDRVTVNLALEKYDQSNVGGTPRTHTYRLSQVIDLPDVR